MRVCEYMRKRVNELWCRGGNDHLPRGKVRVRIKRAFAKGYIGVTSKRVLLQGRVYEYLRKRGNDYFPRGNIRVASERAFSNE
jgi:hypothetical protein